MWIWSGFLGWDILKGCPGYPFRGDLNYGCRDVVGTPITRSPPTDTCIPWTFPDRDAYCVVGLDKVKDRKFEWCVTKGSRGGRMVIKTRSTLRSLFRIRYYLQVFIASLTPSVWRARRGATLSLLEMQRKTRGYQPWKPYRVVLLR